MNQGVADVLLKALWRFEEERGVWPVYYPATTPFLLWAPRTCARARLMQEPRKRCMRLSLPLPAFVDRSRYRRPVSPPEMIIGHYPARGNTASEGRLRSRPPKPNCRQQGGMP